jgi:hypothetical protein
MLTALLDELVSVELSESVLDVAGRWNSEM